MLAIPFEQIFSIYSKFKTYRNAINKIFQKYLKKVETFKPKTKMSLNGKTCEIKWRQYKTDLEHYGYRDLISFIEDQLPMIQIDQKMKTGYFDTDHEEAVSLLKSIGAKNGKLKAVTYHYAHLVNILTG